LTVARNIANKLTGPAPSRSSRRCALANSPGRTL